MTGTLQPLEQQFAIVDAQGRPTEYFIRWAQQKQIDIGDSITLGVLQDFLTAHALQEGEGIAFTPDGDLNNAPSIAIRNGTGLDFDAMHNIKIADTAAVPGSYGDSSHIPKVTVDQQGRITDISQVPAAGGGGALTLIGQTILGASTASIAFTGIPATFEDLIVVFRGQLVAPTVDYVWAFLNGDMTVGNYEYVRAVIQNGGAGYVSGTSPGLAVGLVAGQIAGANYADSFEATIYGYAQTNFFKQSMSRNSLRFGGGVNAITCENLISNWLNTSVVNALTLQANSGVFSAGSIATLYGRG